MNHSHGKSTLLLISCTAIVYSNGTDCSTTHVIVERLVERTAPKAEATIELALMLRLWLTCIQKSHTCAQQPKLNPDL